MTNFKVILKIAVKSSRRSENKITLSMFLELFFLKEHYNYENYFKHMLCHLMPFVTLSVMLLPPFQTF